MIFQTYLSIVRSRAFDRENCFQTRNDKQTLITSSLLRHKIIFLGERCRVKVRGRVGEGGMVGEEEVADEEEAEVAVDEVEEDVEAMNPRGRPRKKSNRVPKRQEAKEQYK